LLTTRRPACPSLFPYTTLFRSHGLFAHAVAGHARVDAVLHLLGHRGGGVGLLRHGSSRDSGEGRGSAPAPPSYAPRPMTTTGRAELSVPPARARTRREGASAW